MTVNHEEWLERAEIFSLSALEGDELAQFEAHLSSGCSLCRSRLTETANVFALACHSLEPIGAPSELKSRILDRIEADAPDFVFTSIDQLEWQEVEPGVLVKILFRDAARNRITAVVRMRPASHYSNHRHTQPEELFILEGSCYCGGQVLRKGDYHRAEIGSVHLDTRTDEGSLMLMITSAENEMLP